MKKLSIPVILTAAAFALTSAGSLGTVASKDGKAIFLDNKCSKCHSIESQGIERQGSAPAGGKLPPDLSGVGLKHTSDWMQKWLNKEEEMNGKKHMKKFGGSSDELKTLTSWLSSLKKK